MLTECGKAVANRALTWDTRYTCPNDRGADTKSLGLAGRHRSPREAKSAEPR